MENQIVRQQVVRMESADQLVIQKLRKRPRLGETFIQGFLFFCGAVSILTTLGIVFELGKEALLFFQMPGVTLIEFLTNTEWQPTIGKFGVLPLVNATLMTTLFAMLVALPLGPGRGDLPERIRHAPRARASSSRCWKCWRACPRWYTASLR